MSFLKTLFRYPFSKQPSDANKSHIPQLVSTTHFPRASVASLLVMVRRIRAGIPTPSRSLSNVSSSSSVRSPHKYRNFKPRVCILGTESEQFGRIGIPWYSREYRFSSRPDHVDVKTCYCYLWGDFCLFELPRVGGGGTVWRTRANNREHCDCCVQDKNVMSFLPNEQQKKKKKTVRV